VAICYLCRDKQVIQVKGDTIAGLWPCPKCRLEEFHIRHEVTAAELESFRGEQRELDGYVQRDLKHRFIACLLDAFDVVVEIEAKTGKRTYKMDLWVLLPKTKGS
jgi:hypothetical protein